MIASLGMYDMPHTALAQDALWQLIRQHLGQGPSALDRETPLWDVWQSPDLLFAQTCSLPLRARLAGKVALVTTPDYDVPGCPPGYYQSVIVTRLAGPHVLTELEGTTMAFNEVMSQSGWAAPRLHLAEQGIAPSATLETGAHAASACAVAAGKADFAALDALTWTLLRQADPGLTARLHVIAQTAPTPALPYITANHRDPAPIARAVSRAITDLQPEHRATLHLRGLVTIPIETYLNLPMP